MKHDKLIYDVRESLNQNTDDSNLSDEYLSYLIGVYRAEILKNELNNFQRITNVINIQSFCLEMEEVSVYDCNINLDCETVLRSKQQLPSLIKTHIGNSLTTVRPVDRTAKPFTYIDESRLAFLPNSRFAKSIYYFIGSDMHLYLVGKTETYKRIKCINVSGVFADPLELSEYKTCCGCDDESNACFDLLETDYPISSDQIPSVITLISQRLISKFQIPNDLANDGTSNI